ncbi:MAG: hypothetical protein LBJ63_01820 [Prevotellaceae bacterium]|jgi:hypothetical protein|nr:hypothetical protein [Prevotellaceae bacterium]
MKIREKIAGLYQYRHKTLQILKNHIFSSFVLIQKKQKVKSSRRYTVTPIYGCDLWERRLLNVLLIFLHVDQLKSLPVRKKNKS